MTIRAARLISWWLALIATAALAALAVIPARAQENSDVAAAARSVVRVALVENVGEEQYLLGHGSGFAVTPDMIVTNAHVVAPMQGPGNLALVIVPAEGSRRYVGRLLAVDPRSDLALIRLESGSVPPATVYTGPIEDSARVGAIGYPGSVDLAQDLSANDRVTPMEAVRTYGQLSGARSRRDVNTLLHTAPMAAGHSGGPLVDPCGRIIGINSFGSISTGSDAEFGFAISTRELMPFLRAQGVDARTIGSPCESMAERDRRDAERRQAEARDDASRREAAESRATEAAEARETMRQTIAEERETSSALAALLLVIGGIVGGGGLVLFAYRATIRHGMYLASGTWGVATVLLIAAVIVFVTRPTMADLEARLGDEAQAAEEIADAAFDPIGANVCTLDRELSRITVSQPEPIEFDWGGDGCRDGDTQFGETEEGVWQRPFVPGDEPVVEVDSFDTNRGAYSVMRYQMSAAGLAQARQIRARYREGSCDAPGSAGDLSGEIAELLPRVPNEHLVYECRRGGGTEE